MHHRIHVRPRLVDLAMDEALDIGLPAARVERLAVEVEGYDVGHRDVARGDSLRLQVLLGIARVAHADMAEAVEHGVVDEDVVG